MVHITEQERIELLAKIQELLKAIWIDEQEIKRTHELFLGDRGYTWVPKSVDEIRIDSRKIVQEIVDRKPHNNDEQEHER